ncbi:MAG: PAS domain-containing protein, partial [Acetobacteraceae bacterium]
MQRPVCGEAGRHPMSPFATSVTLISLWGQAPAASGCGLTAKPGVVSIQMCKSAGKSGDRRMREVGALSEAMDLAWGSHFGTYEFRPPAALTWSPGMLKIYGLSRQPETIDAFKAMIHPDDRGRVDAEGVEFIRSGLDVYSHTFRILRPDGTVRVVLDRGTVEREAGDGSMVFRGANVDVTDEVHLNYSVERQLRVSEERYRKLFNAIDDGFCIVEVDLDALGGRSDYRVIEANPAFYAQTGFPPAILGSWLRAAAPGLEEHWFETYARVARTRQPVRFESESNHLGRWFDVYAFPLDHPEESQVAILFSDISSRKAQEEQAQLLLGEINHRSKNMLGVIQAIARNTMTGDGGEFVTRFGERVAALAATNDLLVRNGWKPVVLEDLIRSQLDAFTAKTSGQFLISGPEVKLSPAASKALGMALHELATNAAKYGALSVAGGQVSIGWALEPGKDGETFRLEWRESGGPTVNAPQRRGFGWTVTKRMVESTT